MADKTVPNYQQALADDAWLDADLVAIMADSQHPPGSPKARAVARRSGLLLGSWVEFRLRSADNTGDASPSPPKDDPSQDR